MSTSAIARFLDGDVYHSFKNSPVAVGAAIVAAILILGAVFAPWVAPFDPFDLKTLDLNNSLLPPPIFEHLHKHIQLVSILLHMCP